MEGKIKMKKLLLISLLIPLYACGTPGSLETAPPIFKKENKIWGEKPAEQGMTSAEYVKNRIDRENAAAIGHKEKVKALDRAIK